MEFVNNLVSFQYKKHLLIESKIYTPKVIVLIEQNKGCTARVIKEPKLETMDSFGLFSLNSLRTSRLSFLMNC